MLVKVEVMKDIRIMTKAIEISKLEIIVTSMVEVTDEVVAMVVTAASSMVVVKAILIKMKIYVRNKSMELLLAIPFYKCGMSRHWSLTCRMTKHLVDLYQASVKRGKNAEANFNEVELSTPTLDISNYLIKITRTMLNVE